MNLPKLNFEQVFDFKFRQDKDNFFIYDPTRRTWLLLTPEEWVRQHWIQYFLTVEKWPASAIIAEQKIMLHHTVKRIDLLIRNREGIILLLECKAPGIRLTEQTFDQIARYNSVLQAPRIILSNGLTHIEACYQEGRYSFRQDG